MLRLFSFSRSRGRHPIGRCLPAPLHNELRPPPGRPGNACSLLSSPQLPRPGWRLGPSPGPGGPGGAGQGRGCCSRLTGSGGGGASSSGVPRWGATCRSHTWSGDVRPAEGPAPAPPRQDLGEAGLTHRPRLPPFPVRLPRAPFSPSPKQSKMEPSLTSRGLMFTLLNGT